MERRRRHGRWINAAMLAALVIATPTACARPPAAAHPTPVAELPTPAVTGIPSPASATVTSQHYEVRVSPRTFALTERPVLVMPSLAGSPSIRHAPLDRIPSPRASVTSPPPAPETSPHRTLETPLHHAPPPPETSPPPAHHTTAPPPPSPGPAPFRSSVHRIDASLTARMHASYHPGCPVPLADLRDLHLSYWGFDGKPHTGEMVVSARVAADVVTAFRSLYTHRFPIHRMQLVDDFGGSDDASMAADNTSAFNCRPITGGGGWSEHSYGEAVDINPVENPYLSGSTVLPPAGRAYLGRPDRPGVIHPGGVVVAAFAAIGWTWGGAWTSPVDLQHFSRSGR